VTVASATEQVYSAALPAGITGTVYIRVLDTDRGWGNVSFDAVFIDEMYIEFSSGPTPPVAQFAGEPTSGPAPLAVQFTDLSTGSPTSWSWTFGDGGTSTAQHPSHTYNDIGTYTVTLVASNAYGSDTETKTGYITVTDPNAAIHVGNMVVTRVKSGPEYMGSCVVTIVDQNGSPVGNATVFADYDGPTAGSVNGLTAGDGTVTLQSSGMKKPAGEWCFTVTNVTHPSQTYDPGSNAVTRACESGWVYGAGGGELARLVPDDYGLDQNYPNPFNPTTEIAFSLPNAARVTLEVFNVVGQRVAVLADGTYGAGSHIVTWDAAGNSSGVYFYRLTTTEFTQTKKMMLIK
jgi:PKD repeat protein